MLLNDIQYINENIQNDLYASLLKFCTHTYALTANIKLTYQMILINLNWYNMQRILRSKHANKPPKDI